MKRRIGKFYVTFEDVETRRIASILKEMSFVPHRVEALYFEMKFEYIGTSPLFKENEKAEVIPEYNVLMNEDGNGSFLLKVEIIK